ncbi:hypothetical protein GT347_17990 [Xylophilus rhododendri]|uniref:Tetratricopeptide repeat protein n=1 Tax=Xylophilus rhododendri TaxID=2697032 RepID=A0A857J9C2_9BURK|nr:hypothetical protein [Xylophilus rhododendri]QHI99701.1 hypothetical protein GT347_17990 [Xylophilus rhododendri]
MDTRPTDWPAITRWQTSFPWTPAVAPDSPSDPGDDPPTAAAWPLSCGPVLHGPQDSVGAVAAFTPPADRNAAPDADPRSFAQLIEWSLPPGLEPNARLIHNFNHCGADADKVQKVTSIVMRQCGKNWNEVLACVDALKRCRRRDRQTRREEVVCPNHFTYAIAIAQCQRAGRADKVSELLDHLLQNGPSLPDPLFLETPVYSIAISECEADGRADDALALFDHLLRHGPDYRPQAWPQAVTYNGAIATCMKAGRTDDALELYHHLRTCGPLYPRPAWPLTITYNMTMTACVNAGRDAEALAILDQLLQDGPDLPTPVYPDIVSLCLGLEICERLERLDRQTGLIDLGIAGEPGKPGTRLLHPALGFDAARNELDLYERAVLLKPRTPFDACIHPALARAICRRLVHARDAQDQPAGIDPQTRFLLRRSSATTVKKTVVDFLRLPDWSPQFVQVESLEGATPAIRQSRQPHGHPRRDGRPD